MSHGHRGPALFGRGPAVTSASLATQKAAMRAESAGPPHPRNRPSSGDVDRPPRGNRAGSGAPSYTRVTGCRFAAFLPIRREPDCLPLLHALVAAGLDTALPVTPKRGLPLRFHRWRPGEPLVSRAWGLSEPALDAAEIDPDVLFVPLAAFDRRGHRLGYGAGFYDNALAVLRARKPVLAIGVAFALQEVEAVPAEPHDERLDMIVTEQATHVVTDR